MEDMPMLESRIFTLKIEPDQAQGKLLSTMVERVRDVKFCIATHLCSNNTIISYSHIAMIMKKMQGMLGKYQDIPAVVMEGATHEIVNTFMAAMGTIGGLDLIREEVHTMAFTFPQLVYVAFSKDRLYLPKIGWIACPRLFQMSGQPDSLSVKQENGEWIVRIFCEVDVAEDEEDLSVAI
jgi:hypothetical protein